MISKQTLKPSLIIPDESIIKKIYYLRGKKVMFDRDLSELYEVETKVFNQAVKRNIKRFPDDFMFQLNKKEADILLKFQSGTSNDMNLRSQIVNSKKNKSLRSQIVTLKSGRGQHLKYLPYVFTEQGVAMLSSVLKSDRAIEVNIQIIRTFTKLREILSTHKDLQVKIEKMEKYTRENFKVIFKILAKLMTTGPQDKGVKKIGFEYV